MRDAQVRLKLQLFIYACKQTILILSPTSFSVCVPSQASIFQSVYVFQRNMKSCFHCMWPNIDTFVHTILHTYVIICICTLTVAFIDLPLLILCLSVCNLCCGAIVEEQTAEEF